MLTRRELCVRCEEDEEEEEEEEEDADILGFIDNDTLEAGEEEAELLLGCRRMIRSWETGMRRQERAQCWPSTGTAEAKVWKA